MKKIFILGGSSLQLDIILEAKKMLFYTVVLDMDKECVGKDFCDEFLQIDIANKEKVLEKAKEYKIDLILTSSTELGNVTSCWVGEKLALNTNSYEIALNTTNKQKMKNILIKNSIKTATHKMAKKEETFSFDSFPCIVKPLDSSAGRGLSFVSSKDQLQKAINKAFSYSLSDEVIVEEYIKGRQFSIETISCKSKHQILAINEEFIREIPDIIETAHQIPALISDDLKSKIEKITFEILNAFNINFGAAHIEIRVQKDEVYVVELATRTGGMRSEMINFAFGISYSQMLILSALGTLSTIVNSRNDKIKCNFLIDYEAYEEYLNLKETNSSNLFEPFDIPIVDKGFKAQNLGESKGYYFILNP